jgi:hypothetical protein
MRRENRKQNSGVTERRLDAGAALYATGISVAILRLAWKKRETSHGGRRKRRTRRVCMIRKRCSVLFPSLQGGASRHRYPGIPSDSCFLFSDF